MLAMSAKLVPVWSVTIDPSGIGVPVAATPGLVPQDEVLTAVEVGLAALDDAGALLLAAPVAAGELELLLLLHPARTPIAMTATATPASRERRCSNIFMGSAFSWLTAKYLPNGPERRHAGWACYPRRLDEAHVVFDC